MTLAFPPPAHDTRVSSPTLPPVPPDGPAVSSPSGGAPTDLLIAARFIVTMFRGVAPESMISDPAVQTALRVIDRETVNARVGAWRESKPAGVREVRHEGGTGYDVDVLADSRRDRLEPRA